MFVLRSPHRPNPIGLHTVTILEITADGRFRVYPLEVIDGTPVIDIKYLDESAEIIEAGPQ